MSRYTPKPMPCPCGERSTRSYFLGWRCDSCRPSEAAIRANAIARAKRNDARLRERAVPNDPRRETR